MASLILYFAAAAPTPQCLDAARLLRKAENRRENDTSPSSPPSSDLAFALSVHAAIRAGDGLKLCQLRSSSSEPAPSWRAAILCEAALARARKVGLETLAAAYRSLPAAVAVERLGLEGDDAITSLAALIQAEVGEEAEAEGDGGKTKQKTPPPPPPPPPPAWAVRALAGAVAGGELVFKG